MEVLAFDRGADWLMPLGKRLRFWLRSAGRCQRGQAALEYGGVLLVVTLVIAALAGGFGAAGWSGTLRSVIQRELCVMGVESFGGTCPGAVRSPPSRASADATAIRRALSNGRLVDACAGGPSADAMADQTAPTSVACKGALAALSPHQLSLLAVLAATIQSRQPGNGGNFAVLLDNYLTDPADAVIALSPRAQVEQARGNDLIDALQKNKGDGWDRLLGAFCGADGICLGGNKLSQSYQEGFRASAAVGKISGAVLLATGIAGALRDVALPGLRVALERLGVGAADARQAASAAGELEGVNAAELPGPALPRIAGGSHLEDLLASGQRPDRGGLTAAGRALEKHQGEGAFPLATGDVAAKNALGQRQLEQILSDPATREEPITRGNFAGGTRYIAPDGRGATFDSFGKFRYFGVY